MDFDTLMDGLADFADDHARYYNQYLGGPSFQSRNLTSWHNTWGSFQCRQEPGSVAKDFRWQSPGVFPYREMGLYIAGGKLVFSIIVNRGTHLMTYHIRRDLNGGPVDFLTTTDRRLWADIDQSDKETQFGLEPIRDLPIDRLVDSLPAPVKDALKDR